MPCYLASNATYISTHLHKVRPIYIRVVKAMYHDTASAIRASYNVIVSSSAEVSSRRGSGGR